MKLRVLGVALGALVFAGGLVWGILGGFSAEPIASIGTLLAGFLMVIILASTRPKSTAK